MKILKTFWSVCLLGALVACNDAGLTRYVDTMIGTDFHAHCYPGSTLPFAMVQLSPDNGPGGWDWCGGYHASDTTIVGFSHTHISGTGVRDLGDIMLMPAVGETQWVEGAKDRSEEGYRSPFDKTSEVASPAYYSVRLTEPKVTAELTSTLRCGVHRYRFDSPEEQYVVVDLAHGIGNRTTGAMLRRVDECTIEGVRRVTGWAKQREVWFRAEFSEPFAVVETKVDGAEGVLQDSVEGVSVVAAVRFARPADEIEVRVALSMTSAEGARLNFEAEVADVSFEEVHRRGVEAWNEQLNKIVIDEDASEKDKRVFYTAMYHAMVTPNLFSDVNGDYVDMKRQRANAGADSHYTLFSLWDTYRATHPLYTIIAPQHNQAFVRSMIAKWRSSGLMPIWESHSNENFCMIGYHSVAVIADSYMKGQRDFDAEAALQGMVETSQYGAYGGIDYLMSMGYLPYDKVSQSVSKGVEYAFDDWCIAQMAAEMGDTATAKMYESRAQLYRNYFDVTDGFLKGRDSEGNLRPEFDPTVVPHYGSGDFIEGNGWHYAFYVPHDVYGHIELIGGDEAYVAKLDEMFEAPDLDDHSGAVMDVTGSIGQYTHGNEPSHQVPYLYAYAGCPWKTQMRVRQIMDEMYDDTPDGLCGNEDCGQLSAWYVFSALGFYPVAPASNVYVLGAPRFESAEVAVGDGVTFRVKAKGVSAENKYVASVLWNGEPYTRSYITHEMVMSGGELTFNMSSEPNTSFGHELSDRPR